MYENEVLEQIQLIDVPDKEFNKFFKVVGNHCFPTNDCLAQIVKWIWKMRIRDHNYSHSAQLPEEGPFTTEAQIKLASRILRPFSYYAEPLSKQPIKYRKEILFDEASGKTREVRTLGSYFDLSLTGDGELSSPIHYTGAISKCFPDTVVIVPEGRRHPRDPLYKDCPIVPGYKLKDGWKVK